MDSPLRWYDWQHILETYRKNVTYSDKVLEVGSSVIERTSALKSYCGELMGVELYSEKIPSKSLVNVTHCDWQELSTVFEPETFDFIISSHVIEHVEDDVRVLNESCRALKPGGKLLFNTPNRKRFVRAVIEFFAGDRVFPFKEHLREYTHEDIKSVISSSDFAGMKCDIKKIGFSVPTTSQSGFICKKIPTFLEPYANYLEVLLTKE